MFIIVLEITVRSRAHDVQEDWKPSFLSNEEFTYLILEALEGFVMVFSATGCIFYVSESITSLLGHKPVNIVNLCDNIIINGYSMFIHCSMKICWNDMFIFRLTFPIKASLIYVLKMIDHNYTTFCKIPEQFWILCSQYVKVSVEFLQST